MPPSHKFMRSFRVFVLWLRININLTFFTVKIIVLNLELNDFNLVSIQSLQLAIYEVGSVFRYYQNEWVMSFKRGYELKSVLKLWFRARDQTKFETLKIFISKKSFWRSILSIVQIVRSFNINNRQSFYLSALRLFLAHFEKVCTIVQLL